MSDSETHAPAEPVEGTAQVGDPLIASGARWFWWIAGLSLINLVLQHSGSDINFVVGLGATTIADIMFSGNLPVALLIDASALGFFALMGWQALRGNLWAFYLGGAMYLLDALIYVWVQDWMSVAFHGLALYFIAQGALKLHAARAVRT